MANVAGQLEGLKLDGGWTVIQRLAKGPDQTGGRFSEGYLVVRDDGTKAFLKALDYSGALNAKDPAQELLKLTGAYVFERDLLARCRRMDRVVTALSDGSVRVAGQVVQYLIFERADHDVRKFLDLSQKIDEAWMLRCLHHVATGLEQLHGANVAHQDLKPSNVLVFGRAISKVADLGRATLKGTISPHEDYLIAGDPGYAPPELLYGYVHPEWPNRRLGCDAYHLGSLVAFLFARANLTPMLVAQLNRAHYPGVWAGTFGEVLPYLREAFNRSVELFAEDTANLAPALGKELTAIVRQLGDPDPALRGEPRERGGPNQYSLQRYVTRFDLLASRAEIGLFRI